MLVGTTIDQRGAPHVSVTHEASKSGAKKLDCFRAVNQTLQYFQPFVERMVKL